MTVDPPPLRFAADTASAGQIAAHLRLCDSRFAVALSSRVDIEAYAQKIASHAIRFEAWSGDALVSLVAAYAERARPALFVTNVSTLGAFAGRGLATRLLRSCIDHARRDARDLRLEVASADESAIRLYRACGFADAAVRGAVLDMCLVVAGSEPRSPAPSGRRMSDIP